MVCVVVSNKILHTRVRLPRVCSMCEKVHIIFVLRKIMFWNCYSSITAVFFKYYFLIFVCYLCVIMICG